jgi:predicted Zn-dependent protease
MKNFKLVTIFISVCLVATGYADGIIRDSEIEEAIELTLAPLKKASGMEDLKIHIIDDPSANAFTPGGSEIYVSSGLIIDFPDPDVLRGVIAHEIGHIKGKHIVRRQGIIDSYSKAAISSTILGIATAMSGHAEPGIAIAMGGYHFSERSIVAYSRGFESSADQTAMLLLEKSGHSTIGLINFFEKMKINSKESLFNEYDQSHPLSKNRLLILQSFNKRSKFPSSQNSAELKYKFARSSSKLMAYLVTPADLCECKCNDHTDEINHYIKAIKCFRVGNFDDALHHVQKLLMLHPKDPFYHELKGQILFEAGKKMALEQYDTAVALRPNDPLIRLGRAIVGITQCQDDPMKMNYSYKDLLFVIQKEPDNLLARFYLAMIYEKQGLKGKSYLNSAIISYKTGKTKMAKALAKESMKELKEKSPEWYSAYDIFTNIKEEDEKR